MNHSAPTVTDSSGSTSRSPWHTARLLPASKCHRWLFSYWCLTPSQPVWFSLGGVMKGVRSRCPSVSVLLCVCLSLSVSLSQSLSLSICLPICLSVSLPPPLLSVSVSGPPRSTIGRSGLVPSYSRSTHDGDLKRYWLVRCQCIVIWWDSSSATSVSVLRNLSQQIRLKDTFSLRLRREAAREKNLLSVSLFLSLLPSLFLVVVGRSITTQAGPTRQLHVQLTALVSFPFTSKSPPTVPCRA